MDIKAKCVVCGNEFTAGNKKAKYCSRSCQMKLVNNGYRMPKRKREEKTIEEWNAEARAAGMSYGQYRAMKGL